MFCFDQNELEELPLLPDKQSEPKQHPNSAIDLSKPMELPDDMPAFIGDDESLSDALLGAFGLPVDRSSTWGCHPWVTYALLLLCTAGLIVSGMYGFQNVNRLWGFIPSDAWRCGGATFITAAFLHTGIVHFAGNLYFLWLSGKILEQSLKVKEMMLLFVCSLLSSKLFYLATAAEPDIPCVGASGFIAGFMACCAVTAPTRMLSFTLESRAIMFLVGTRNIHWIDFPVWFCFILWFALQLCFAFIAPPESHVAFTSHIGGAIAGAIFGLVCRYCNRQNSL